MGPGFPISFGVRGLVVRSRTYSLDKLAELFETKCTRILMFIAIALSSIIILWMSKDILRQWFEQKEKNLQVGFSEDDLKQAKKITKLDKKIDEFIEEEGPIVSLKSVRNKLKGKTTNTPT